MQGKFESVDPEPPQYFTVYDPLWNVRSSHESYGTFIEIGSTRKTYETRKNNPKGHIIFLCTIYSLEVPYFL